MYLYIDTYMYQARMPEKQVQTTLWLGNPSETYTCTGTKNGHRTYKNDAVRHSRDRTQQLFKQHKSFTLLEIQEKLSCFGSPSHSLLLLFPSCVEWPMSLQDTVQMSRTLAQTYLLCVVLWQPFYRARQWAPKNTKICQKHLHKRILLLFKLHVYVTMRFEVFSTQV